MLLSGLQNWKKRMRTNLPSGWGRSRRVGKRSHRQGSCVACVGGAEVLESRTMLTSYVVDSPLDTVDANDGQTTLREAITQANATAGHDTITFQISGTGPQTIVLAGMLPTVNDTLTIDGSSQPGITIDATGVAGNVLRLGSNADGSTLQQFAISNAQDMAVHLVGVSNATIDGLDLSYAGSSATGVGLRLSSSDNNVVQNVIATDRANGILLAHSSENLVEQNDVRGARASGIGLIGGANANLIQQNDASGSWGGINAFVSGGLGNQFLNNDLSDAGSWGLTVRYDSQFVSVGNDFTNCANGVWLGFVDGMTLSSSAGFELDVSTVAGLGLSLNGVTNSTLDGLDLSYAGSGASGNGLRLGGSDSNTLSNLTVSGRNNGIVLSNSDETLISCSSLTGNGVGLWVNGSSVDTTIMESQIEGNGTGVLNLGGNLVMAEQNYWGAADGPGNLGGSGDTYSGNVDADPFLTSLPDCLVDVQTVEIEVKPDSEIDTVNLASKGVLPVVLYSTEDFDASLVDVGSVTFAGAVVDHSSLEDVDGDGDLDLVLHFRVQEMEDLEADYLEALEADLADNGVVDDNHQSVDVTLSGMTVEGQQIEGVDTIDAFFAGKAYREALNSI